MGSPIAHRLWQVLEPYHAVVYFAPETKPAFVAVGLSGFWMGYFASRSAPLGRVPPEVVTATFFGFDHAMVGRALPAAWDRSDPATVTAARLAIADGALRRLLGSRLAGAQISAAADLAREAVEGAGIGGRPLYAAYRAERWPEAPHLALWHAATLLREHRGDGHVAALVAAGLDGCEAQVLQAATGVVDRATLQAARGWSDEAWDAAARRLAGRGWLDDEGVLTPAGRDARWAIETVTDMSAAGPWDRLGPARSEELLAALAPIRQLILAGGGMTFPNPIGLSETAIATETATETDR
jgi:hypothetical protein